MQLDEFESALACYDEVIARFGDSDAPDSPVPRSGIVRCKYNWTVRVWEI